MSPEEQNQAAEKAPQAMPGIDETNEKRSSSSLTMDANGGNVQTVDQVPPVLAKAAEVPWSVIESKHNECSSLILGRLRSPDWATFLLFVDRAGNTELYPTLGNFNLEKIVRIVSRLPARERIVLSSLVPPEIRKTLNLLCTEFVDFGTTRAAGEKPLEIFPEPRRSRRRSKKKSSAILVAKTPLGEPLASEKPSEAVESSST